MESRGIEAPVDDISREQFTELTAIVHEVVHSTEAEPFYFEEYWELGEDQDATGIEAGMSWAVPESLLDEGEGVSFGLYNEDGRYAVGGFLDEISEESLPHGHIDVTKSVGSGQLNAMIYLFESGRVFSDLDLRIVPEDVLSEDSEACYDFAERLGLGREWVKFMFRAIGDRAYREEFFVKLDEDMAAKLIDFLNTLQDRL